MDRLSDIWKIQADQQRELGLDPAELSDVQRRRLADDLVIQLHEEATEIGRLSSAYKRHVLRSPRVAASAVADECADVLKTLVAAAQLYDVTPSELFEAFQRKTEAVAAKHRGELLALEHDTRVFCTDLDDVVCDLSPFRDELGLIGRDLTPSQKLSVNEKLKAEFYEGGRFREMEPIAGAAEALRFLSGVGFRIVVITARPQWQYKRLYADTICWLKEHEIPVDLLLFHRNKVEALYEHVVPAWPLAFVEDHERNARDLSGAGVNVILYDQPHNEGLALPGVKRAFNWEEILGMLEI